MPDRAGGDAPCVPERRKMPKVWSGLPRNEDPKEED
jgi:hypothetical protein